MSERKTGIERLAAIELELTKLVGPLDTAIQDAESRLTTGEREREQARRNDMAAVADARRARSVATFQLERERDQITARLTNDLRPVELVNALAAVECEWEACRFTVDESTVGRTKTLTKARDELRALELKDCDIPAEVARILAALNRQVPIAA